MNLFSASINNTIKNVIECYNTVIVITNKKIGNTCALINEIVQRHVCVDFIESNVGAVINFNYEFNQSCIILEINL